jgi:flagellar motor protein MotB
MGKSNEKKRDFFWLSYSDLMTSLFFVMLVLFILVFFVFSEQNKLISDLENANKTLTAAEEKHDRLISDLRNANKTLTAAKEELDRIKEIEKTVNNIDKRYFRYDPINKKHILNMQFSFPRGGHDIRKIASYKGKRKDFRKDFIEDLLNAGNAIKKLIERIPEKENIKYLVVVEGQASNDGWKGNDDLSYHRAQSLVNFWESNNVGLEKLKNCEIVIAGSGVKGVPRDFPDTPPRNQRFLITIIPKIGEMKKK